MTQFQYLGSNPKHTDNDWSSILWNIGKAWVVWRWLGNMLQQWEEDRPVLALFYREVIQ